jgi:hypothetical protein
MIVKSFDGCFFGHLLPMYLPINKAHVHLINKAIIAVVGVISQYIADHVADLSVRG